MVNKAILVGRLGADPEIRYTADGRPVTIFRIATTERWTDKNGNRQEHTEWHRIVVFGKLAEVCAEHLSKGSQVYVEGRLHTRSYEDKEGIVRYMTEVVAQNVVFLGSKPGSQASNGKRDREEQKDDWLEDIGDVPEDDLPF